MQDLIPTKEAAKVLGLTPSGVSRLVERGEMQIAWRVPGQTGAMFFDPREVGRVHVERIRAKELKRQKRVSAA